MEWETAVEIRVLGPVEVRHADKQLYLARRQQRLILGILSLEANRLITCDRLIERGLVAPYCTSWMLPIGPR